MKTRGTASPTPRRGDESDIESVEYKPWWPKSMRFLGDELVSTSRPQRKTAERTMYTSTSLIEQLETSSHLKTQSPSSCFCFLDPTRKSRAFRRLVGSSLGQHRALLHRTFRMGEPPRKKLRVLVPWENTSEDIVEERRADVGAWWWGGRSTWEDHEHHGGWW